MSEAIGLSRSIAIISACLFAVVALYAPSATRALQDGSTENASPTTVRFCYQDIELFPNYTGDGSDVPAEKPGVNIELYNFVAEQVGVDIEYFRYSWNRCIALLSAGRIDSIISSYSPARAAVADFPMAGDLPDPARRITTSGYFLYHLDNGKTYWNGKQLTDPSISIGAPLGYSIVRDLKAMNANVTEAGTTGGLLNLLLYGRFDAIAAPGSTTEAMIRADITRLVNVVRDPLPLKQNAYYIAFSKNFVAQNPDVATAFWSNSTIIRDQFRESLLRSY